MKMFIIRSCFHVPQFLQHHWKGHPGDGQPGPGADKDDGARERSHVGGEDFAAEEAQHALKQKQRINTYVRNILINGLVSTTFYRVVYLVAEHYLLIPN